MNQPILVALIAATSVAVGAILTFIGTVITARHKIKEIEVTQRLQLDEHYRTNARAYKDTLYIPINVSLWELEVHFSSFKKVISTCDERSEEYQQALKEFREACEDFEKKISALFKEGLDAYLTDKLDKSLRSFTNFLRNSKDSQIFSVDVRGKFLTFEASRPFELEAGRKEEVRWLRYLAFNRSMLRILLIFSYLSPMGILLLKTSNINIEILAAPITSISFDQRLANDISYLKSLIKEVTLGQ